MVDKTRENRMRRMAHRQGLRLVKLRVRDPRALGFGGYMIVKKGVVLAGEANSPKALTIDQVESYLLDKTDQEV